MTVSHQTKMFVISHVQKFIAVTKEDAGEYFCRARNDAGFAECPPQTMEVCKCVTDLKKDGRRSVLLLCQLTVIKSYIVSISVFHFFCLTLLVLHR